MNKTETTRSQRALRRLLIVAAVVVGVVVYAYGWDVTEISLEPTQDATRQDAVTRALRELFSPNIFTQDRDTEITAAPLIIGCDNAAQEAPASETAFAITLDPPCGTRGSTFVVTGAGFTANADVYVRWVGETGQPRALGSTLTDASGGFSLVATVPTIRGMSSGHVFSIEAIISWPVGSPRLSDTTNLVIEKMIETIFLALMATTLALPVSVVVSFMAAHNLMRPIRMPVGKALIGLALLPVGWWVGTTLLGPVGAFGVELGKSLSGSVAAPAILIFASAAATRLRTDPDTNTLGGQLRGLLTTVAAIVAAVLALGIVSGLGIWLSESMATSSVALITHLGTFLHTIGRLVELTIVPLAGVIGAFVLGNLGMRLISPTLRHLPAAVDHAGGAVLGGIGGALIMLAAAAIGTQAALMALLTPLVAGVLGAQIPVMLYDRVTGKTTPLKRTATDNLVRTVLRFAGFIAVAVFTYNFFDVSRAVVDGRLPVAAVYLPNAALVGAVLGGIAAGLSGMRASMPIGDIVYNTTRTILNALRSIEPLIMGIVFVIWVGIGPFAGVLALTLHSIASLGKLYSEQIESIDEGPIEALQATGANRLQMMIYAVVPQIVPPYIAFTLYRWDINVRMSTIIGFVGGGGVGFLLQQQVNLLRYRDAGVAVLAIAIVVSILDYASAAIRERYV